MRDKRVPKTAGTSCAGHFAACGWAVVQVAIDDGGRPWNAGYERMPCGCSVQRSITRSEMLALYTAFCKMNGPGGTRADYMEAVQPQRKYKVSSTGPKRNDAVWRRFTQE